MPRHPLTSPLSVLLAGVVVILLMLAGSGTHMSAITRRQDSTPSADAYGAPSSYAGPSSSTSVGTETATIANTSGTATPTRTTTVSPLTPTSTQATVQTPTDLPSTDDPAVLDAVATPTPTPADAITCAPGVPLAIAGAGPPGAPVLLYFGERPVGGGSITPSGRFELKLIVGQERAGDYRVTVRVRGTSRVLRELTCAVPVSSATPTPDARRP